MYAGIPLFVPSPTLFQTFLDQYQYFHESELCRSYFDEEAETVNLTILNEPDTACPERTSSGLQVGRDLAFLTHSDTLSWLQLMDYYHMPHVMQFGTTKELVDLLQETDLPDVSLHMATFSEEQAQLIRGFVNNLLDQIAMLHSGSATVREMPADYDHAMQDLYQDLQIG